LSVNINELIKIGEKNMKTDVSFPFLGAFIRSKKWLICTVLFSVGYTMTFY